MFIVTFCIPVCDEENLETFRKYRNNNLPFNFGRLLTENTITTEPLPNSMELLEKQNLLQWQKQILQTFSKYINESLAPRKHNFYDLESTNFVHLSSIYKILVSLDVINQEFCIPVCDEENLEIFRKYRNNNLPFNFGRLLTENTITTEPLPNSMELLEKQNLLQWQKQILQTFSKYINESLAPRKHNFYDLESTNFVHLKF